MYRPPSPADDRAYVLRVAGVAPADPRSVVRELRDPYSVRGLAGSRIRRAIDAIDAADAAEPDGGR